MQHNWPTLQMRGREGLYQKDHKKHKEGTHKMILWIPFACAAFLYVFLFHMD